jgi:membrane protease YdiL (CAAX protease family)
LVPTDRRAGGLAKGRSTLRAVLGRRPGPMDFVAAVVIAGVGTAALLAYFRSNQAFVFAAAAPTGAGLVGLALLNAVVEEGVWRGACLSVAMRSGLRPTVGVLVQASSFGLAHLVGGFPAGWPGVALTAAFGVTQGYLTLRTGSIALPVLVHAWLDVVIANEVLSG